MFFSIIKSPLTKATIEKYPLKKQNQKQFLAPFEDANCYESKFWL